jgi:hypothetical protein
LTIVLRDGWRGIHRKVDQGVEILAARPSRAPRSAYRRARLPRTPDL